jgi:hypothetical protein
MMPGDIDFSPNSETSRIQSRNNNYKNANTNEAQISAPFLLPLWCHNWGRCSNDQMPNQGTGYLNNVLVHKSGEDQYVL